MFDSSDPSHQSELNIGSKFNKKFQSSDSVDFERLVFSDTELPLNSNPKPMFVDTNKTNTDWVVSEMTVLRTTTSD